MSHFGRRYHRQTFALLGRQLRFSRANRSELDRRARELGIRWPDSVREWYTLRGAIQLLDIQDHPVPLEGLGTAGPDHFDIRAGELLPFMWENQGCCWWAVRLDGSDDPPVMRADVAQRGLSEWHQVTDHFSTYILSRVWSWRKVMEARGGSVNEQMEPLTPCARAFIAAQFVAGPRTWDWPDQWESCYRRGKAYLWLHEGADDYFWCFLGADTRAALVEVLRLLWHPVGQFSEAPEIEPPDYPGPGWHRVFGEELTPRFANGHWLQSLRDTALVPPAIDFLIDHFDREQRRNFGSVTAYHFSSPSCRAYVVSEGHEVEDGQASWWLHADSAEELYRRAHRVRRWGNLRMTLTSTTPSGQEVLRRLEQSG